MAPTRTFVLGESLRPFRKTPELSFKPFQRQDKTEDEDNAGNESDATCQDFDPRDSHLGQDAEADGVFTYSGPYGWVTIGNDAEAQIERSLRTPKDIPYVWKYRNRSITRDQAMEKYKPIAQKFRASMGTADATREIRGNFSRFTIKVLPAQEKRLIEMNAKLHYADDICDWLKDARKDRTEFYWKEKYKCPKLTDKQVKDVWEDLRHLSYTCPLYQASRLDPRIETLQILFNEQKARLRELEELLRINDISEAGVSLLNNKEFIDSQKKRNKVKRFLKRLVCERTEDGN